MAIDQDSLELCYLTVDEVLGRFRRRELSPPEYLETLIRRAEDVEPSVNAFTYTFFDEAMASAAAAAERYAGDAAGLRPLEGLPLAVKELSAVAGQPQTLGSVALQDNVADASDVAIQRAIDAGAIVHARTNTPEFGCASFTHNELHGLTRNPWNLDYSPAGSSGGSAAALAAGTTPLAQGTDSAGSLRLPASACGIVGFKAAYGRVPLPHPLNLERCNHYGPMARSVRDVSILYRIMAGPHVGDLASWIPDGPGSAPAGGEGTFRRAAVVNVPRQLDVDHEVQANFDDAVARLERRGVIIEHAELSWSYDSLIEATEMAFTATYAPAVAAVRDLRPEALTSYAAAFLERVGPRAADRGPILEANSYIGALGAEIMQVLERVDVLLMPTLCFPAPLAGEEYRDAGPVVDGRSQPDRWIVGTTVPFNLLSQLPAISVPSGRASTGVPTGMQVIGRPYDEPTVLDLGARALQGEALFAAAATRPSLAAGG